MNAILKHDPKIRIAIEPKPNEPVDHAYLLTTDCYNPMAIATINLDRVLVHLDYNRVHFPAIHRKYHGRIAIQTPPNLGSALITSLVDDITALDIVREFGLELLDDYFNRSAGRNRDARAALV